MVKLPPTIVYHNNHIIAAIMNIGGLSLKDEKSL